MQVRNWSMALTLAAMLMASNAQLRAADSFEVDPAHSFVTFKVSRGGASFIVARFNGLEGKAVWDEANPAAGSLELTIQTGSVDSGNERRDTHIKSPDFLNAKQFPVITYKSSKIEKSGADAYNVTGDFSLHGVTKPLTITLKKVGGGETRRGGFTLGYEAEFIIKRKDFGVGQDRSPAGEDVHCNVNVLATRQ